MAGGGGRRRRTVEVLDVGAGAGGEEGGDEAPVREGVGEVEGGVAAEVLGVDVGAAAKEEVHDGGLGALRAVHAASGSRGRLK